jgi:hypothetical protein
MQYLSVSAGPGQFASPSSRRAREFSLSQANDLKVMKIHSVVETLLQKMLVRGVHGEALVRFIVQDGMIELIEECVRRKHR